MSIRSNMFLDLARMMIKQARLLKAQGMYAEARAMARRAIEFDHAGHALARLQPVPARIGRRR